MIYVNKLEKRSTFKIKARYYLKLLMRETIKLLGNFKSKITKDENGKICLVLKLLRFNGF